MDKWIPKIEWPPKFDGKVLVYAPSLDPLAPFIHVAWWDGKSITGLPLPWLEAVTHIHMLPVPPDD